MFWCFSLGSDNYRSAIHTLPLAPQLFHCTPANPLNHHSARCFAHIHPIPDSWTSLSFDNHQPVMIKMHFRYSLLLDLTYFHYWLRFVLLYYVLKSFLLCYLPECCQSRVISNSDLSRGSSWLDMLKVGARSLETRVSLTTCDSSALICIFQRLGAHCSAPSVWDGGISFHCSRSGTFSFEMVCQKLCWPIFWVLVQKPFYLHFGFWRHLLTLMMYNYLLFVIELMARCDCIWFRIQSDSLCNCPMISYYLIFGENSLVWFYMTLFLSFLLISILSMKFLTINNQCQR